LIAKAVEPEVRTCFERPSDRNGEEETLSVDCHGLKTNSTETETLSVCDDKNFKDLLPNKVDNVPGEGFTETIDEIKEVSSATSPNSSTSPTSLTSSTSSPSSKSDSIAPNCPLEADFCQYESPLVLPEIENQDDAARPFSAIEKTCPLLNSVEDKRQSSIPEKVLDPNVHSSVSLQPPILTELPTTSSGANCEQEELDQQVVDDLIQGNNVCHDSSIKVYEAVKKDAEIKPKSQPELEVVIKSNSLLNQNFEDVDSNREGFSIPERTHVKSPTEDLAQMSLMRHSFDHDLVDDTGAPNKLFNQLANPAGTRVDLETRQTSSELNNQENFAVLLETRATPNEALKKKSAIESQTSLSRQQSKRCQFHLSIFVAIFLKSYPFNYSMGSQLF